MRLKQNESGRSMVEMLGVLAVIGVLSVTGIAGFNLAMNRHHANELLNEASKRAVVVSASILRGETDLSIAEFTNPAGYAFNVGRKLFDADQFIISIDGVAKKVCEQMKNVSGGMIVSFKPDVCDVDNHTIQLTYNNDLSNTSREIGQDPIACTTDAQCGPSEECTAGGFCKPKCPNGYLLSYDGCHEMGETYYSGPDDSCPEETSDAFDGICCKTGYRQCETGHGFYCCKTNLSPVCTDGTWNTSGTAYCVNGQWKTKQDFDCNPSDPNSSNHPFCS